jgi:hypothetical protein
MFKGKESPFGPIHEFKVYKYNSEQQPIIIWVKFTKEFQGSLLYKSISFFYQNELQGTKGFLRAFFAKNK